MHLQARLDKAESDKRKRDEKKEKGMEARNDRIILDAARKSGKNSGPAEKNKTGKKKESATDKRRRERAEELEKLKAEEEKEIQARRQQLISEGLTPRILDDDLSAGSDDMQWAEDQWEVVDHAVDSITARGNFKVVTGMRSGDGEATKMWMWGRWDALVCDGLDKSVLEDYVRRSCNHPVYDKPPPPPAVVARVKKPVVRQVEKPKQNKACNHSSYSLGLSYHPDPEVNPRWCAAGYFLSGVKCAVCGSPFVEKAPPARERGDPQAPSGANAVYCCINLRNRTAASEEGCSHACCKACWDEGVLQASNNGARVSRRST
jgi:hypothetical protein